MKNKKCSECGKEKSITEFHKNKNCKDGLQRKCKQCRRQYDKRRIEELHDGYIVTQLIKGGWSSEDIIPDLIECKRIMLKTKRYIKNDDDKIPLNRRETQ